jgi:predicted nucleic acid-binding protein
MTRVFADTSYFLALLNPIDELHHQAVMLAASHSFRLFTSDFVLLEIADGLAARKSHQKFAAPFHALRIDTSTNIVPATRKTLEQAEALYLSRRDKGWTLTDCTSFILMKRNRINDTLSADKHFEQAGFRILMKA